jgi:SNF2 family DNA or RNA helicase
LPHQIEAVYHHILRNPRLRFLLADDPGAGKTIMTGLLLKELKYRGLVQRALICVPGHLKDQWLREMKERFNETFTVVDRSVMNATWGRNVWQEQPLVITSMDFAKQEDVTATLAETQWDFVVVDEAHKMAAYRYGDHLNLNVSAIVHFFTHHSQHTLAIHRQSLFRCNHHVTHRRRDRPGCLAASSGRVQARPTDRQRHGHQCGCVALRHSSRAWE